MVNKTVWELFQFFQFSKKLPLKTNDNVYLKQGDFYLNYKNENNHDFLKKLVVIMEVNTKFYVRFSQYKPIES